MQLATHLAEAIRIRAWNGVAAVPPAVLAAQISLPDRLILQRLLKQDFLKPHAESEIPFVDAKLQQGREDTMRALAEATPHSDDYLHTLEKAFNLVETWVLANPLLCGQIRGWGAMSQAGRIGTMRWLEQLYTRAFETASGIKMPQEFGLKLFSMAREVNEKTGLEKLEYGFFLPSDKTVNMNVHADAGFSDPAKALAHYMHELTHAHGDAMGDALAQGGLLAVGPYLYYDAVYFQEIASNKGYLPADIFPAYIVQCHEKAAGMIQRRMHKLVQRIAPTSPAPAAAKAAPAMA